MKIQKSTTGGIVLKKEDGTIRSIIKSNAVYLHVHPRNPDAILLSDHATKQADEKSIVIRAQEVTEIDGAEFSGDRDALLVALDGLFNLGGGSGVGVADLNFPFIGKGWLDINRTSNAHIAESKRISGYGINDSRKVRAVDVNGTTEYWVVGSSMHLLRFDENLTPLGNIPLHSTVTKTNNRIQYTIDFIVDYDNDKIYFACHNRHVVRVFQFSALRDGNYVAGNKGSGGHLYDIGIEASNAYWASSNSAENNDSLGYLGGPIALEINPITGGIIIASLSGYAKNQTLNWGFVSEYSPVDGSYVKTIAQQNGAPASGGVVHAHIRNPRSMAIIGNHLYISNYNYYIPRINLANTNEPILTIANYPIDYDNSNFRFKLSSLKNDGGNLLTVNANENSQRNKHGLLLLSPTYNPLKQAGNFRDIADINNPYKMDSIQDATNVGDRGLGLGDWYIVSNYDQLQLVLLGEISDGSNGLEEFQTYYEVDADPVSIPSGWEIESVMGVGTQFDAARNKLLVPIEELLDERTYKLALRKI